MLSILAVVTGVLAAPEAGVHVVSGVGFGQYIQQQKDGPRLLVPFEEVGAEGRLLGSSGLVFGVQASVRGDDAFHVTIANPDRPRRPGSDQLFVGPEGGPRWRLAPFVSRRWTHVRAKAGLVLGNYYDPSKPDGGRAQIFPVAMVGTGSDAYAVELGLFDSPAVASAASGGLGVLSIRTLLRMADRHHLVVGLGCGMRPLNDLVVLDTLEPDDRVGYFAFAWRAELPGSLLLDVGGYLNDDIKGGYASLGFQLW
jgi:hypothetical protein